MIGGAGGVADDSNRDLDGARVGPPPDLPSLLLHNRIVYLGMPLVPAVTELIIAEVRGCRRDSDKDRKGCNPFNTKVKKQKQYLVPGRGLLG